MYSIDFETYYDKDVSLKVMSTWSYVFHPKTQAYLVAVHNDEFHWVGEPKDFDWLRLHGQELWAHNAAFDALVWQRLVKDGIIPVTVVPARWLDTADLSAYLRHPRALKDAVREFFGVDLSKSVRDRAKGKTVEQMKAEGWWDDMVKYGGADAEWCYKIAKERGPEWPECERTMSTLNREAGWVGLPIDWDRVEGNGKALDTLVTLLHETEKLIPWVADGGKPLSPHALRSWGRDNGIAVPSSLAKTDEDAQKFFDTYAEQYPPIKAVREWRSINMLLQKVQRLVSEKRADGTVPYQCKYFGADTGRMSGGGESAGKLNIQNMPKNEMYGVDFRGLIMAPADHHMVIADYAQIESRLLHWEAGDTPFIDRIQSGMADDHIIHAGSVSPYQAHAETSMGWDPAKNLKKCDPKLYFLAKCRELGLGYQCGSDKFLWLANSWGLPLTEKEAIDTVADYRASNPLIVDLWAKHKTWLANSVAKSDPTHDVQLASGRWLTYFNPRRKKFISINKKTGVRTESIGVAASYVKGETPKKVYGGLLVENLTQANARDILRDAWVALVAAGFWVLWTVHDEFIIAVPKSKDIEQARRDIARIMCTSSPWAAGCPLEVEINVVDHYTK